MEILDVISESLGKVLMPKINRLLGTSFRFNHGGHKVVGFLAIFFTVVVLALLLA